MDRLTAFTNIAIQAGRGELTFPTNVNAALKIKQFLDNPDCNMDEAARLLLTAPLIAARTVAMANSAAYNRSGSEITNVRAAVMRLGFKPLHSLVAAEIVRQFSSKISAAPIRAMAAQLWEHSAHVAALAHVIARKVSRLDPDTAMFAGIVHEIGGFYLLCRAEDFPGVLDGEADNWQEFGEKAIGRRVLGTLAVPATVTAAVESLWFGMHVRPPVNLGDTLLLANELAPVASPLHQRSGTANAPAAAPVDFAIGDETLQGILAESAEEIRTLTASLLV